MHLPTIIREAFLNCNILAQQSHSASAASIGSQYLVSHLCKGWLRVIWSKVLIPDILASPTPRGQTRSRLPHTPMGLRKRLRLLVSRLCKERIKFKRASGLTLPQSAGRCNPSVWSSLSLPAKMRGLLDLHVACPLTYRCL